MWNNEKPNTSFQYPTSIVVPTYPALQTAHEPEGWCQRNYKNKPQSNSAGAAALIFISGGMFLIGPTHALFHITLIVRMSWFIGGIVGAIVGAITCNKIQKRLITCTASILVSVSGILLVSDPNTVDSNITARFINGCAVGLVFPLTHILAGEQVVKSMRGMTASSIDAMCYSMGMFLQIIYANTWPDPSKTTFSSAQMMGALCIFWGLLSLIFAIVLQVESPLVYLSAGREDLALDCLRRLQRPFTITYETYERLDELKRYLAESKQHTFVESFRIGLPALLKLCFYRSFMALSFSYSLNLALSYAVIVSKEDSTWSYFVYGILRWVGAFVVAFSIDCKGRRPSMVIGFFFCSCLLFAIGGIFVDKRNVVDANYMQVVVYLLIAYQFFAGISMGSSSAYLSEAFPLKVKPYFIAAAFVVEMLVHIILFACIYELNFATLFFAIAILSLLFFVMAVAAMPETKTLTLRDCLEKFKRFFDNRPNL